MAPDEADQQDSSESNNAPELAPTPLDHPLFLPVLFAGVAIWFGYDAYFTADPGMLEHLDFNRYGFRVLIFVTFLYGYRGGCELTQRTESPLVLPALLLGMTLWLAYDGWLSTDLFNVKRAGINQALTPWLAAATVWYSWVGWLRHNGALGAPFRAAFTGIASRPLVHLPGFPGFPSSPNRLTISSTRAWGSA